MRATRGCVIQTITDNVSALASHKPPNVEWVADWRPNGTYNLVEVRLEGDGLPAWCALPRDGELLIRAVAWLDDAGTMHFSPGDGIPENQVPHKEPHGN